MKAAVLILTLTQVGLELASAQMVVVDPTELRASGAAKIGIPVLPTTTPTIPSSGGLGGLGSVPGVGSILGGGGNPGYNGQSLTQLGSASNSIAGAVAGAAGSTAAGAVGSGLGQGVYPALQVSPSAGWAARYTPYVFMEGMVDAAVKTFNQADANMKQLSTVLSTLLTKLTFAESTGSSVADIEAVHTQIAAVQAAIQQQQYYRNAALQQVQLVNMSNENNFKKRDLADTEQNAEGQANSMGVNPTSIGGAIQSVTLLGVMSDIRGAAMGPGNLQN